MEIDVANNIKAVELLKVELMESVTELFGEIAAESSNETPANIADCSADIILITKLLSRRLGVTSDMIDSAMQAKLISEIQNGHILERRDSEI